MISKDRAQRWRDQVRWSMIGLTWRSGVSFSRTKMRQFLHTARAAGMAKNVYLKPPLPPDSNHVPNSASTEFCVPSI